MSLDRNSRSMLLRVAFWGLLGAAVLAWILHGPARHLRANPPATALTVPGEWVGVWTSTRGPVVRCIELRNDGWYSMVPNTEAGDKFALETGTWRLVGQDIVWRSENQPNLVDKNRLVDVSDGHFKTLEADGSQTKFDRIAAGATARCPR